MRVRDVIVCPTGASSADSTEFQEHPPIGTPFNVMIGRSADPVDLGRSLRLDRLSDTDAELVMNACTPRGHYFAPIRQFGQRYSFVHDVSVEEWEHSPYGWDSNGVLYDALSLSRLVRDHAFSMEYAARIVDRDDGQQTISYIHFPEAKHAYRVREDRDWLDYPEAAELREILAAYWAIGEPKARLRRAMWRAEHASWVKWGDLILPTLVSGLEALLKTERHQATKQFKLRVTALAAELGVEGVTTEFCEEMYDARSDWVHGSLVRLFALIPSDDDIECSDDESNDALRSITLIQDILRSAVRKSIVDVGFRATFDDDESIRARWPA